jgi:hypothetical protein
LGKAPDNKKKKCQTEIPKSWPQFTGPAYRDGMPLREAQKLWHEFLREHRLVGRNPIVHRSDK